jgi:ribonuclease R
VLVPALLIRRGKYSIADPLFVSERRPILVSRKARKGASAGDIVLIRAWESNRSLRGEVSRVLGPADDPRTVYDALFASVETSREFPEPVEREAAEVSDTPPGERTDLRHLPTVTIDGADAKDYDDAITVEQAEAGYRLWVHIADVTHYVRAGGALDREARRRGNSVYLPGVAAPMLPARLSSDVCSLRPHEDRATVTAELEVAYSGELKSYRTYRSVIRSDARLTYEGVDEMLAGGSKVPQAALVFTAHELSRTLRRRALERGKLDLEGREPDYVVDEDGVPVEAAVRRSTPARELIEELMVLANEAVAKTIREKPGAVYRVHERPSLADMEELGVRLAAIGYPWEPTPENLSAIAAKIGTDAGKYLVLRSIPRALYSSRQIGHFGLALEDYTHFTSPIRRYSDVLVHRALLGEEPPPDLEAIADHISEREWQSMIAERTADEYTLMWLMRDRVGDTIKGTVVSTASFGMFVEMETGATGLVHVSKLPGWWELEPSGVVLSNPTIGGRYAVGDEVLVELIDIFPLLQRAELRVVKRL